ncbi:MAG TPA: sugar ABC transporter permease, partial [Methylomirabilota bacterium]|nr:sugar ABC transporter permease [Methylomirabilota bacterium]
AVTAYPVADVLWLSLRTRVPIFGLDEFVGLAHYAFLARDPAFWNAARVTLAFTLASVGLEVVLGVAAALALAGLRRGLAAALGLLLLPWCLPGVVTARAFEWIYHPGVGLANLALGALGLAPRNWLGDPGLALGALVAADAWRTTPFVALLCYARLAAIPASVWEAAAVDGAGPLRRLAGITLPLLAPVLLVAALFRTLDALRAFDLMFILTGGGPAAATETLTLYAYRSLFQTLHLGFGAAVGTLVFALVALAAGGYLAALERRGARA